MVFLGTSAELLDPRVPSALKPRGWGSASSERREGENFTWDSGLGWNNAYKMRRQMLSSRLWRQT